MAEDIRVSLLLDGAERFEVAVTRAADKLDKIGNSAAKYYKKARRGSMATETWTHKLRDFALILGQSRFALANLNDIILGLPRLIIAQNAALEKSAVLLAGLDTESKNYAAAQQKSNEKMETLISISSRSPFALQAVTDSYVKLRVAGIEKTDLAIKALINTAAKYGASQDQLKRASIAIQQMAGKGVISMEELRQQLGEAIPSAIRIMARATGMAMGDMIKMISSGTMESHSALSLFFRQMQLESIGSAAIMSKTWDGTINQLRNQATILAKRFGDAGFMDSVKQEARDLKQLMASEEALRMAAEWGAKFATATKAAGDFFKLIIENFRAIATIGGGLLLAKLFSRPLVAATAALGTFYGNVKKFSTASDRLSRRQFAGQLNRSNILARVRQANVTATGATLFRLYTQEITHTERLYNAHKRLNLVRGLASRSIRLMGAAVAAMGGWVSIAIIGLTLLYSWYDKVIGSQKRMLENLNKTKGVGASGAEFDLAKKRLSEMQAAQDKLFKDRKKQESLLAGAQKHNANGDDQITESTAAIAALDEQIGKSINLVTEYEFAYENALTSIKKGFKLAGEELTSNRLGDSFVDFQRAYLSKLEKLAKEADKLYGGNKDKRTLFFNEKRVPIELALMDQYKNKFKGLVNLFKGLQKDIKKAQGGGKAIDFEVDARASFYTFDAAIAAAEKMSDDIDKIADRVEQKVVKMVKGGLTAFSQQMTSLQILVARYEQQLDNLNNGIKSGTKLAEMKVRIATAATKFTDEEIIRLEKQATLADKALGALREKKDLLQEVARKEKALQDMFDKRILDRDRQISQSDKRLINFEISTSKALAASSVDRQNSYLGWQRSLSRVNITADILLQKLILLKDNTPEKIAILDKGIDNQRQAAINQVLSDVDEQRYRLALAMMSTEERKNTEMYRQLQHLQDLKQEMIELSLLTNDEGVQRSIATGLKNVDQLIGDIKNNHNQTSPFNQWMKDINDMSDLVENKLIYALEGVADAFIDTLFDSTKSLSDSLKSVGEQLAKFIAKMMLMQGLQGIFDNFGIDLKVTKSANGNIMSGNGPLPLSRFAAGGIATSPQLALFGEGRQNEAYVPLPDGRSIPVTMKDGQGQAPIINIINQSGMAIDAENVSTPQFDGEKWVQNVVLKAMGRPGRFRNALKGA